MKENVPAFAKKSGFFETTKKLCFFDGRTEEVQQPEELRTRRGYPGFDSCSPCSAMAAGHCAEAQVPPPAVGECNEEQLRKQLL